MSDAAGADVVIDELVLDGVDPAVVPALLRAIEQALIRAPATDADVVAAAVSDALEQALRTSGPR
jgi:hypothetical protein